MDARCHNRKKGKKRSFRRARSIVVAVFSFEISRERKRKPAQAQMTLAQAEGDPIETGFTVNLTIDWFQNRLH